MRLDTRIVALVVWTLTTALGPRTLLGQEHRHPEPSSEELARLNAEWDRQYAEYQRGLAQSPEVRPGMVVADLGAGKGALSLELSKAVGLAGHVYANDIDPKALAALQQLRDQHRLQNLTVVEGEPNDPRLPPGRVEAAFLLKVYHQLQDAVGFFRVTREQLQPGALLFIVDVDVHQDWGEGQGSVSDPAQCQADALAAGFEIVGQKRFPITDWQLYELVVRKPLD